MEATLAASPHPSEKNDPPGGCPRGEQLMHKNRLQEFTQRSSLPLPVYQTINDGYPHAPRFRSTVTVDGVIFTSSETFFHRKEAEQNVAKIALEGIHTKIKQEGRALIQEGVIFCKSILHEYAAKMNLSKPTYTCSLPVLPSCLPTFVSSVLFDGQTYQGIFARNKKQAEQFAARAVIESILGDSNASTRALMAQIVKSKAKLFSVPHQIGVSTITAGMNTQSSVGTDELAGGNVPRASTNVMPPTAGHGPVQHTAGQQQEGGRGCDSRSCPDAGDTALEPQAKASPPPSLRAITPPPAVSDCPPSQPEAEAASSPDPSEQSNEGRATPPSRKRKHSNVEEGGQ